MAPSCLSCLKDALVHGWSAGAPSALCLALHNKLGLGSLCYEFAARVGQDLLIGVAPAKKAATVYLPRQQQQQSKGVVVAHR